MTDKARLKAIAKENKIGKAVYDGIYKLVPSTQQRTKEIIEGMKKK